MTLMKMFRGCNSELMYSSNKKTYCDQSCPKILEYQYLLQSLGRYKKLNPKQLHFLWLAIHGESN